MTRVRTSHPVPEVPPVSALDAAATALGDAVADAVWVAAGLADGLPVGLADGLPVGLADGDGLLVSSSVVISMTSPEAGSQRKSV